MSESRILVLDSDAMRAERTIALLQFMDFNPRWVAEPADLDLQRNRPNDWMAVVLGDMAASAASEQFLNWLGQGSLPPPLMVLDAASVEQAVSAGIHEANVWPLEWPLRHAQLEALLRRASLKRLDAEHQASAPASSGPCWCWASRVPARKWSAARSMPARRAATARSWRSTAALFRPSCWKVNCSAMRKVPSPAR